MDYQAGFGGKNMFINNWKQEIITLPNLLSLSRLGMIPVYTVIYLNATRPSHYYAAGLIIALSCLTDALDGKIARKYNMVSTLGKILDPIADKFTQFTLTLCLSFRYPALIPVLLLFVVKEVLQTALGISYLFQGKILPGALPAGKISTAVLFISLTVLVLFPQMNSRVVHMLAWMNSTLLTISFFCYLTAYRSSHTLLQDLNPD